MAIQSKDEIAAFIDTLTGSENFYTKYESVKALGKLACNVSVDSLSAIMSDVEQDVDLRMEAIESFSRIATKEHSGHLEKLLEDYSAEMRTEAIKVLGKIGDSSVTDGLIKAMKYQGEELYFEQEMEWDPMWDIQLEAIRALGKIGNEKAVKAIIEYYEDEESQEISEIAFSSLARIGTKEALDFLTNKLADGAPEERRRTVEVLKEHPHKEFKSRLTKALMDKDAQLRIGAARALAAITGVNDDSAIAIAMLLRDEKDWVRSEAVALLAPSGMEDFEEHIIDLLKDESPNVRSAAAEGLKHFHSEKTVQELTGILKEEKDEGVVMKAASSLAELNASGLAETLAEFAGDASKSPFFRIHCVHLIKDHYSDKIVELLLPYLETEPRQVSVAIADLLAAASNPETVKMLIAIIERALKDEPEEEEKGETKEAKTDTSEEKKTSAEGKDEKEECASAVKDEENEGEYVKIGKRMAIKNPGETKGSCTPEEVAAILSKVDAPGVKEILAECLVSGHETLAAAAAESLGILKAKEFSEKLVDALDDNYPQLRLYAAQALGQIGDTGALAKLGELLLKDPEPVVREKSAQALGMIGASEGLECLDKGLRDEDVLVTKTCLAAIADVGGSKASELLVESLFDYEHLSRVRQDISTALCRLDSGEASNSLIEIIKDKERDPDHWAAVQALGEISS